MKKWVLPGFVTIAVLGVTALIFDAYQAKAVNIGGTRFDVPRDVLFMPQLSEPDELDILLKSDALASHVSGFKPRVRGYVSQVNEDVPISIQSADKFDAYRANQNQTWPENEKIRVYDENPVKPLPGQNGLPAACNSSQDREGKPYLSCLFIFRDDGFTFLFWMDGENLDASPGVARYARSLLRQWQVA